jgi:hypothetical membrane protein
MNSLSNVWLKLSGLCGIITPFVAFAFILTAIVYSPEFSWTGNALSDLGIQTGVTATLFNTGLITSGILALLFASGLFLFMRNQIVDRIGVAVFVLDTLALIAIGVFPENVTPTHYYVSVTFFALFPLAMLFLVVAFALAGKKRMSLFTLIIALFAAATWIFQWTIGFGSNVAIPEALLALSASAWSIVIGFKMFREKPPLSR